MDEQGGVPHSLRHPLPPLFNPSPPLFPGGRSGWTARPSSSVFARSEARWRVVLGTTAVLSTAYRRCLVSIVVLAATDLARCRWGSRRTTASPGHSTNRCRIWTSCPRTAARRNTSRSPRAISRLERLTRGGRPLARCLTEMSIDCRLAVEGTRKMKRSSDPSGARQRSLAGSECARNPCRRPARWHTKHPCSSRES